MRGFLKHKSCLLYSKLQNKSYLNRIFQLFSTTASCVLLKRVNICLIAKVGTLSHRELKFSVA